MTESRGTPLCGETARIIEFSVPMRSGSCAGIAIRRCAGACLASSDLRADEQQEPRKENARAPADCDQSHNLQAADAVKSRITNDIDDRGDAGDHRRTHQAEDHRSRYLDRALATLLHLVLLPPRNLPYKR